MGVDRFSISVAPCAQSPPASDPALDLAVAESADKCRQPSCRNSAMTCRKHTTANMHKTPVNTVLSGVSAENVARYCNGFVNRRYAVYSWRLVPLSLPGLPFSCVGLESPCRQFQRHEGETHSLLKTEFDSEESPSSSTVQADANWLTGRFSFPIDSPFKILNCGIPRQDLVDRNQVGLKVIDHLRHFLDGVFLDLGFLPHCGQFIL